MARAAPILSSFNAGELSPRMEGRVDVGKYQNGAKYMENYIPLVQGPAMRRAGTRFVAEVKDSTARTWLVKFEFNTQQAYQIEFGNLYLRFFTQYGQLLATGAAAYAGGTTYAMDAYVTYGGLTYRSLVNANLGNQPDISPAFWTQQTIYEITSPWTTADLTAADGTFNLRFVESNDVVYICHTNYAPRKLSRLAATNWQLAIMQPTGGPFKPINITTTTVYASAATGNVTLTASAAIFSAQNVGSLFYLEQKSILSIAQWEPGKAIALNALRRSDGKNYKALNAATTGGGKPIHTTGAAFDGDTGVQWQYQDPGYGQVLITGFTDSTHVTGTVVAGSSSGLARLPDNAVLVANASTRWAFAAWSDIETWPSQVTFFKERLCFGRGQQNWQSVAGDYENFSNRDDGGVVTADMAISITIQSDKVNNILWMVPGDALLIGTAGAEFAIQAITQNQVYGADNVTAPSISVFGCKSVVPLRIADTLLFVQRSGTKLRDLKYDFLSNKYQSNDQNIMAEHITQGGLTQIAYQQEPYSIVWGVRADGLLVCMTYSQEQYPDPPHGGWHRQRIGGGGVVECVSTMPAPAGDRDDVWLIVKRTINSATKRYVEYLEYERVPNSDPESSFYVDAGLSLNNTKAVTLTPDAGATVAHTTGVAFTAGAAIFSAGDVGKEIHYRYNTTDVYGVVSYFTAKALITAFTDTTHVVCTINAAFPSLTAIAASGWRLTVTTITGLSHLEGATVQVLADGATHADCVVSGGAITLSRSASRIHVGFNSAAKLQTLRLNAGAQDGTSQGKTARVNKATIRVLDSLGLKYGRSFDNLDEVDFRTALMNMDNPPALYTGDLVLDWPGDYDTNPWLCFVQDQPLPSMIVAVMPIVSVQDRG